jgi:zinc protease
MGQIVPLNRRDPDYAAARLLSQVFGESFSGRLNESLRIEKGLTYGARGYFDVDVHTAAFISRTFTRTEKTIEAVHAAMEEIELLYTGEFTQEELDTARDAIIGGLQLGMETPSDIADMYWQLKVWGLPEHWYTDYQRGILDVKKPQALADVARRTIDPKRIAVIIVGVASEIEEQLAAGTKQGTGDKNQTVN